MWNRANIYKENKEKNMKMDQNKLFILTYPIGSDNLSYLLQSNFDFIF